MIDTQGITLTVNSQSINCMFDLGDINLSRAVNKTTCINNDNETISVGGVTKAPFDVTVPTDPANTAGQNELEESFNSKIRKPMVIELNDKVTPVTGNGTKYTFNGIVTGYNRQHPKDDVLTTVFTIEIDGAITETPAD